MNNKTYDFVESFPLHWPAGWPRTRKTSSARFNTSLNDAYAGLMNEIRLLGGNRVVLSTNRETYVRGGRAIPYSKQTKLDDTGAAVYFMLRGEQRVFACDRWDTLEDNVQAIRKTIEAIRGIERWGSSEMMDRMFTGFLALPDPNTVKEWWVVLGLDSPKHPLRAFEEMYKHKAKTAHPDTGGSDEEMSRLNEAITAARKYSMS